MLENTGVVAILGVVMEYGNLFLSFTFFLDGFHFTFGYKLKICSKVADFMKIVCDFVRLYKGMKPCSCTLAKFIVFSVSRISYYANADTRMKKEAIEKATSRLNPLFQNNEDLNWENDEKLLKKLYGLS